jgi:hypothetical protein
MPQCCHRGTFIKLCSSCFLEQSLICFLRI